MRRRRPRAGRPCHDLDRETQRNQRRSGTVDAGSFVVLLVWVYYSAQILFLGAEFTQVYTKHYGPRPTPQEYAEPLTEAARAQQGMSRELHLLSR